MTEPITPLLGTDAYTGGDALGPKQSIDMPGKTGIIRTVLIHDSDDQGSNLNVWFFDTEPAGIADDAAFALLDADMDRVMGLVLVDTYQDGINNQVGMEHPNIPYVTYGGKMHFQLETLATPTYTAAGIKVRFIVEY